jgi:dTDP-4-amino-4,6-dideoxygalactose transaminase
MLARREALAGRYSECLAEAAAAGAGVLPTDSSGRVWYRYVVAVDNASALRERLATHGILAAQPVDNWCADATPPASASAHCRLLSLPLYPTLSGEEQDRVVEAFLATFTASVSA